MLKETDVKSSENVNGIKILVTRYFPKDFKKSNGEHFTLKDFFAWYRELAPSPELLNNYLLTNDEKQYREQYVKEVLTNPEAVNRMKDIWEMSKNNDVYLICREPSGYFCHRHILINLINDLSEIFESDRKCPYFMEKDLKARCSLKYLRGAGFHYAPSRKRRRGLVIWHKTLGHPEKCDFYYYGRSIRESMLKDCVLYISATNAFTCHTCYFYEKGVCLKGEGKRCKSYVQKDLRFGNYYIIYQIVQLSKCGIDLKKLLRKYSEGKELKEIEMRIIEGIRGE